MGDAASSSREIHHHQIVAMKANRVQRTVRTGAAAYRFFLDLYYRRGAPILVYQMGRVASTSIARSLRAGGARRVFRCHTLNPAHVSSLRFSRRFPAQLLYGRFAHVRDRRLKVISPVRDPMARNISTFFKTLHRYVPHGDLKSVEELRQIFIEHFDHDEPEVWFDREIKEVLGVDVYAHPFDSDVGHTAIVTDDLDLLVFKVELPEKEIEHLLEDFLRMDRVDLVKANQSKHESYADLYRQLMRAPALPEALVSATYASRYAHTFYSATERSEARLRWTDGHVLEPGCMTK
jgi:hypothetical protein